MGRFINLGIAIVNTSYIIRVEMESNGRAEIYMSDGTMFRCDHFDASTCFGIEGRCRSSGLRVYLVGTNPIKPVWPLLAIRSISLSVAKTKGSILPSDISITKAQGQISLSPSSSR